MNSNLAALQKLAKGFDEDERRTVLAEMPVSELIIALNNRCEEMALKIKGIENIVKASEEDD